MRKLNQKSVLILAVLVLNTYPLYSCRNPAANRAFFKTVQEAAEAFAKRQPRPVPPQVTQRPVLSSFGQRPSTIVNGAARLRKIDKVKESAYMATTDVLSLPNSSSDDLKEAAYRYASREAQEQGIFLSEAQLNEIAGDVTEFAIAELQVLKSAYFAAQLRTHANNASLEELRVAAFQGASQEARKQGISLSEERLTIFAVAAASAVQEYQQEQQQSS